MKNNLPSFPVHHGGIAGLENLIHLKGKMKLFLACVMTLSFARAAKAQDYVVLKGNTIRKVRLLDSISSFELLFQKGNRVESISRSSVSLIIRENRKYQPKVNIIVHQINGMQIRGQVAYADSAGFMVWKGKGKYHPGDHQKISNLLPWSSIQKLSLKENRRVFKNAINGVGSGLIVASAVLGPSKNLGFNFSNCTALPSSDDHIMGAPATMDISASIRGDLNRYLMVLGYLQSNSLLASPPLEYKVLTPGNEVL